MNITAAAATKLLNTEYGIQRTTSAGRRTGWPQGSRCRSPPARKARTRRSPAAARTRRSRSAARAFGASTILSQERLLRQRPEYHEDRDQRHERYHDRQGSPLAEVELVEGLRPDEVRQQRRRGPRTSPGERVGEVERRKGDQDLIYGHDHQHRTDAGQGDVPETAKGRGPVDGRGIIEIVRHRLERRQEQNAHKWQLGPDEHDDDRHPREPRRRQPGYVIVDDAERVQRDVQRA